MSDHGASPAATAPSRRIPWPGVAAAVLVVLVAVRVVSDDGPTPDDPIEVPPSTTTAAFGFASAMGYVNAWNEAARSGDAVALANAYPPSSSAFANVDRDADLQLVIWSAAQGMTVDAVDCSVTDGDPSGSITVRCEYESQQSVRELVGAEPVRVVEVFRVDATGIVAIDQTWLDDWGEVNEPFEAWYRERHPGDVEIGWRTWESLDEAHAAGDRRRVAAEEWAAWLERNGCVYDQPCDAAN